MPRWVSSKCRASNAGVPSKQSKNWTAKADYPVTTTGNFSDPNLVKPSQHALHAGLLRRGRFQAMAGEQGKASTDLPVVESSRVSEQKSPYLRMPSLKIYPAKCLASSSVQASRTCVKLKRGHHANSRHRDPRCLGIKSQYGSGPRPS